MKTMTCSELRANYAATLDAVLDDREEVVITRADGDAVVIVPLDDYQSLKETAYLLRSPENARRLLGAIEDLESRKVRDEPSPEPTRSPTRDSCAPGGGREQREAEPLPP